MAGGAEPSLPGFLGSPRRRTCRGGTAPWLCLLRCLRVSAPLLSLALWTGLLPLARGDLDYPHFKPPDGEPLSAAYFHLRNVSGSAVDFYSTEFVEMCSRSQDGGGIANPQGISQRFQHPQRRDDPHYGDLPTLTYLSDDLLDNPYSSRISHGHYTEVVETKAFVSDGDLQPLPHSRTQLCHYAIRLTPPNRSQNTAIWSRFKQLVAYGFETEFHFRVLHRNKECTVAGQDSAWCRESGGDGFAFVVQNDGRKVVGTEVNGLGYGIRFSLAVEFDMYRNQNLGDRSANHVSVHAAPRAGQANTARHDISEIAYADDLPPMQEGTHVVRIAYDTKSYAWDGLGRAFESDLNADFLRQHASGRPGLLTVELDGQRVLSVPIDLVAIVHVDSTYVAQADPPRQPNASAYDERGATPGRAWVGFTSSTSYFQYQSVDILSWTFREKQACPGEGDVRCRINDGTTGRTTCDADGSELCTFEVQNIARQAVRLSARLSYDLPEEGRGCENGAIQWDALHPYFLGCSRAVHYTGDLAELWVNTFDGLRATSVTDAHILQQAPIPFKRRSVFRYCVKEHAYDHSRLYFAQCNCEFCVRLLDVQASYAVFYQHRCLVRYGLICPCYEASEVTHDSSQWSVLEPLAYMRLHTCRGCAYTSQCASMLKVAFCEQAYQQYQLGNPLAPNILANGFEGLERDQGRVADGKIRGDACNCEPQLRPHRGASGRAGMCSAAGELARGNFGELDGCADLCMSMARGQYFTYWKATGECITYSYCAWENCASDSCFYSATYRLASLGTYIDTRGQVQEFNVYPRRTVQSTPSDCQRCLHLYEEVHCATLCGPARRVSYTHWPAGQLCATCIFAGNRLHELQDFQLSRVKACVYEAIRVSEDPWEYCNDTVQREAAVSTLDLFNGVSTHFLSECPGRPFAEAGAVCMPNLYAIRNFSLQVLSRQAAINDTVWSVDMECINAVCQMVPRSTCYYRLGEWSFTDGLDGLIRNRTQLGSYGFNSPDGNATGVQGGSLRLERSSRQYVHTEPVPFLLENISIEAWVEVGGADLITNIVRGRPAEADTRWKDDYEPGNAIDGDFETYWSSQVGELGRMLHDSVWEVDLNRTVFGGAVRIYWKEPAADFSIWVSEDNVTWNDIASVENNYELLTVFNRFFKGRWVRLVMTRAATLRPQGIGEELPVFSVREFEVLIDINLARLKPTHVKYNWYHPAPSAIDGDTTTYWLTPPHTPSANLFIDLGRVMDVQIIRIFWRYAPQKVFLLAGDDACDAAMPGVELQQYAGAQVFTLTELNLAWRARCLALNIVETGLIYGEHLVAVREVELYQEAENLAAGATVNFTWPNETNGGHVTPVSGGLDGDPTTYWMMQPVDGTASLLIDLGMIKRVMSIEVRWATVANDEYKATRFAVLGGTRLNRMVELDSVQGFLEMARHIVVFTELRYVQLEVIQIMSSNPGGRLALEDFIVYATSDNLANRSTAGGITATSEWACGNETCYLEGDGGARPHGPAMVVDEDLETWWGAPLGIGHLDEALLTIEFASPIRIDIAAVLWRYPAREITAWCSIAGVDFFLAGGSYSNWDYITPIPFAGGRTCSAVRFLMKEPREEFAQEGIIGIRDIEIYDFDINYAMQRPVNPTWAAEAVDGNDVTTWSSLDNRPTNVTVDLGVERMNAPCWGVRLLFSSSLIPRNFYLASSDDDIDENFRVIQRKSNNEQVDVYMIARFTGRYVRLALEQTTRARYSVRTFAVFGGVNKAYAQPAFSSADWNHSAYETVDGDSSTFWVSEPLSTYAQFRVDFSEDMFVAGGISIRWKFPAEDFAVFISQDAVEWESYYSETGNTGSLTEIGGFFEARYIEVRMYRPSELNGDGSYAVYDFDVLFDPNLAHYKTISVTHIKNESHFREENAIDDDMISLWMPQQGTHDVSITFDLYFDRIISGFDVFWRHPPARYRVEREEPDTGVWTFVASWSPPRLENTVGLQQTHRDGFGARRLKIQLEEVYPIEVGMLVSLKEVLLYLPTPENMALQRAINASHAEILGNLPRYANDGNWRGTYWQPGEGVRQAWLMVELDYLPTILGDLPPGHSVARMVIEWRWPPNNFQIEFYYDNHWRLVHEEYGSTDIRTDFFMLRRAQLVRITIESFESEIGILELYVYNTTSLIPPAVEPVDRPWRTSAEAMIDPSYETYWMSNHEEDLVTIDLDLGRIYAAYDILIRFGFKTQGFELWISTDNVTFVRREMTSEAEYGLVRLEERRNSFRLRYVRVRVIKGYRDIDGELFGTSIKDIAVQLFRNLARNIPGDYASSTNIWDYPPGSMVDGQEDTVWISRLGAVQARIAVDLGRVYNVAGLSIAFGYTAGDIRIKYSLDGEEDPTQAFIRDGNFDYDIEVPATIHFRARHVVVELREPRDTIFHPDTHGVDSSLAPLFSIRELRIWEHTGGGGVLGLESLDGMQFTTVAYGLRQPGEWIVSSENDRATVDFGGGNYQEDVGNKVHIVLTMGKAGGGDTNYRLTEYVLYRNGVQYGEPYRIWAPAERLVGLNNTRFVFGARSSAHAVENATTDPREGVRHGYTHDPFFEGRIYNMSIVSAVLSPEEVRGVYDVHTTGGTELGCHCYDACPTGSNRFFPGVLVPCSGQGVCLRMQWGPTAGRCQCQPGYSGPACEDHCSELSSYGCCEVDDDCPELFHCNPATKACDTGPG